MADTPNGEGQHIMGLGLDISQYVHALQQALDAYNVFSKQFSKTLSIRIDPQSLNAISNAFGVQIRQSMGMLQGAHKETVAESIKAAKQITNAFDGAFGLKGFKEMPKKVREAREQLQSELGKIKTAAEQTAAATGAAIEQGVKKGAEGAQKHLAEVSAQTQKEGQAQLAMARGQVEEAERIRRTLAQSIARAGKALGGEGAADRVRELSRVDPTVVPLKKVKEDGKDALAVDRSGVIKQLQDIRAAASAVALQMAEMGEPIPRTTQLYERLGATFDRVRNKFDSMSESARKRTMQLIQAQQQKILGEPGGLDSNIGARGPITQFRQLEDLTRSIETENSKGDPEQLLLIRNRQIQAIESAMRQAAKEEKDAADALAKKTKAVEKSTAEIEKDRAEQAKTHRKEMAAREKLIAQALNQRTAEIYGRGKAQTAEGIANTFERNLLKAFEQSTKDKVSQDARMAQAVRSQAQLERDRVIATARAGTAAAAGDARLSRIGAATGLRFDQVDPKQFIDKSGLIDRASLGEFSRLTKQAANELIEYNRVLDERNRVIKDNTRDERRISAALEKAKAKAPHLAEELDRRAAALRAQLRAVPAAPIAGPAISTLSQRYGVGARSFVGGMAETQPAGPRVGTQPVDTSSLNVAKGLNTEASKLFSTQKGITSAIQTTVQNMFRWLVLYKAVHEITRLIQTTISQFVRSGIEYTRQLESQQLALRAILAENAEVSDHTGRQLKGMAALTALQVTSRQQWAQIQQASLAVVGTTADMMTLYAGILPFASKLGADLERVQELTKATAVSAGLLDVSFQDARSAMISLLQGRALVRNRLVGALGFTKDDLGDLKGTDRLDFIMARMDAFLALSDDAQNTLAALTESFKDFTGIIASGFTTPLTDIFKDFVKGLTDSSKAWSLFEQGASGLKLRDNMKAFLSFASQAIEEVTGKFRKFLGEFIGSGGFSEVQQWVLAIKSGALALETFTEWMIRATVVTANFVARNREFIKWIAGAMALRVLIGTFVQFVSAVEGGTGVLGMLGVSLGAAGNAAQKSVPGFRGMQMAQDAAAQSSSRLSIALAGIGRALVITGIIASITMLIQTLARARQEVKALDQARKALEGGDVPGVIQGAQDPLAGDDAKRRYDAAKLILDAGDKRIGDAQAVMGQSGPEAIKAAHDTAKELAGIQEARQAYFTQTKLLERRLARLKDPKSKEAKDLEAEIALLRSEQAPLDQQLTDVQRRSDTPKAASYDLVAVKAEWAKIEEAIAKSRKALQDNAVGGGGNMFDPGGFGVSGKPPSLGFSEEDLKALEKQLARQKALFSQYSDLAETFDRNLAPDVNLIGAPTEPEPDKHLAKEQYRITADEKIAIEEKNVERLIAIRRMDNAMAKELDEDRAKSDAQMAAEEEALYEKLSEFKVKTWQEEAEHYKKHVAGRKGTDKEYDHDQVEEMQLKFKKEINAAEENDKILKANNQAQAAERRKAFQDEMVAVRGELGKRVAGIYGLTEESAIESFDKAILDIKQKLKGLAFNDPQRREAQALVDAYELNRDPLASKARAEDTLQTTEKTLQSLRQQEALLLHQFEVGEIKVGDFLQRVQELRSAQTGLLQDQIDANRVLLSIQEQAIARGTDAGGEAFSPAAIAKMQSEVVRLKTEIQQIGQAIADINSEARKVERAFQAWAELTGQVREFLSVAEGLDGTNTGLEKMIDGLTGAMNLFDRITRSAKAFAQIPKAISSFRAMFTDADGGGKIGGSFRALGGLIGGGISSIGGMFSGSRNFKPEMIDTGGGPQVGNTINAAGQVASAGSKFAAAIPAIGIAISAALGIGMALFNRAVEKHKKGIERAFEKISKGLASGALTLGKAIADAENERARTVRRLSSSKSGRKALKEMLPQIDDQIDAMKQRAKDIRKNFEDAYRQMIDIGGNTMKPGPFSDFTRELLDLEKFVREYLDSINTSTQAGLEQFAQALENVNQYVSAFFENAKRRFSEELLGFESDALATQERLFSLINTQDGLYKQLGSLAQDRLDLEEQIQDEQERRQQAQEKINDLAEKELEIRKRIAEIIRQAAEDEMAIRRRGVLEAQLSVAQQKAMEISNVRARAQEEVDRLRRELAELQDDARKDQASDTKENTRKDRDFARRAAAINEREQDIRKEMQLNDIRIKGAQAVVALEGEIFGIASNEFELLERQNALALAQAQIQVQKWRETKSLMESIFETAEGYFFDPPVGFPQIRVQLGSITIDNSDNSSNSFGSVTEEPSGRPPSRGFWGRMREVATGKSGGSSSTPIYDAGTDARLGGFGDVE